MHASSAWCLAIIAAMLLASCGGGGGGSPAAPPVPTFRDVAGSYVATVRSTTGIYTSQVPVGTARAAQIDGFGHLNTTDNAGHPLTYQLTHGIAGTTSALLSVPRSLSNFDSEQLNGPDPLTSMTVVARDANGNLVGMVQYALSGFVAAG